MRLNRQTLSLCPTCYREVPARVEVTNEGVFLHKTCRVHGPMSAMLERDPLFYTHIQSLKCPSIYPGHFVDVTQRCNLRCETCYYPLVKEDPDGLYSIDNILAECEANVGPFILTGGEPTLRPDLPDIIREVSKIGPVELVTNGVKLANDAELYESVMELLLGNAEGLCNVNLSIHHKENKDWLNLLDRCREDQIKLESALIVVNNRVEFDQAMVMVKELREQGVIQAFRIKAATRIWNEQKPDTKIFVSDMLKWIEEDHGGYQLVTNRQNKSVFVNVIVNGAFLMLVSWHDAHNVDLLDIDCPPTYRARNGEVRNMVTSMLINEGMQKGYCKGVKM